MNTDQYATAWSKLRVFAAVLGVLALMAGCATTRPDPYPLSSGRIGVALASAPHAELATVKNVVGDGAVEGLRPAFSGGVPGALVIGPLVAPFTVAYGAARGAACQQELDVAYAGLSEKYAEIVQREFSLSDLQRQFVAMLRERTWAPVVEVEAPYGDDSADRQQQLLLSAAQRGLEHLFVVKIQNVRIEADFEGDCDILQEAFRTSIGQLWGVADRKLVIDGKLGAPFAYGKVSELKSVLDEPGALHARLVSILEAAATRLLYDSRFLFPP